MNLTSNFLFCDVQILQPRSIRQFVIAGLFLSLLTALPSQAAQFYRYKNESGQTVLTQTLPAEYADDGYEVINEKGRVISRVAPALTAEQIRLRDEKLEQERLAKIEAQKQLERDEELKQLYSEPNDAVRALNRKFIDIQGVIEIKRNKIQNVTMQIMDEESRAAERQRKGYSVGEEALEKISMMKKDIENTKLEISELFNQLDTVHTEFDQKIKRLEMLTNKQATNYPVLLETIQQFKRSQVD